MIVVWLIFLTGIDGPIWSSHRDSARVSTPPAGQISPRICTPINGAAAPLPVRIEYHDVDHGVAVGRLRRFCVIEPIAFVGGMGGWCCRTWCVVVFAVALRSCAGYFLFHVCSPRRGAGDRLTNKHKWGGEGKKYQLKINKNKSPRTKLTIN